MDRDELAWDEVLKRMQPKIPPGDIAVAFDLELDDLGRPTRPFLRVSVMVEGKQYGAPIGAGACREWASRLTEAADMIEEAYGTGMEFGQIFEGSPTED